MFSCCQGTSSANYRNKKIWRKSNILKADPFYQSLLVLDRIHTRSYCCQACYAKAYKLKSECNLLSSSSSSLSSSSSSSSCSTSSSSLSTSSLSSYIAPSSSSNIIRNLERKVDRLELKNKEKDQTISYLSSSLSKYHDEIVKLQSEISELLKQIAQMKCNDEAILFWKENNKIALRWLDIAAYDHAIG